MNIGDTYYSKEALEEYTIIEILPHTIVLQLSAFERANLSGGKTSILLDEFQRDINDNYFTKTN